MSVSFVSYWEINKILYESTYQFVSDEIDFLNSVLKENQPNLYSELKREINEVPGMATESPYHLYLRVFDDKKQFFQETDGMHRILSGTNFFKKLPVSFEKESQIGVSKKGKIYLFMQSMIKTDRNQIWTVQSALDITYQNNRIKLYYKKLIILLLSGTLISFLIGMIIARKGMHSLFALTETTKNITISSLNKRIDPQDWPIELRNLGFSFNQMLDRIENSFTKLNQFSADLAHELRTPVNNLMGETEIALMGSLSLKDYKNVLQSNLEELHRIAKIIENLLFLARADHRQIDFHKKLICVEEEIKLVFEYYQAFANEKNIKISYHGKAKINADPIMFRRLVNNILSNSLKYTPNNGEISITMSENTPHAAEIVFMDNGIGISEEHLPKIFNRFYRVDAARSHDSGGTGLGLAIVKSIVELHHADISIVSRLNQGTTIYLIFKK